MTRWGHVELDTRIVVKDTAAWAKAHGLSRSYPLVRRAHHLASASSLWGRTVRIITERSSGTSR